ncbi:hypothetical protein BLNAU_7316 [Blattamonas nauphoetae]|uniref:Nucleoplasmin-like domain-containing protein n=1 Tax=Blattamonas nauphoetae TaxID=2049346 RepID=A0ABQ9Y1P9_9EUKA|nr:hypothetical protein BLNAU_7316 [Blattamonas nauphoetae]
MSFFGLSVQPGEPFTIVVPPFSTLHLTNACLTEETRKFTALCFSTEDIKTTMCQLKFPNVSNSPLDYVFRPRETVILSVEGPGTIDVTGMYLQVDSSLIEADFGDVSSDSSSSED